MNTSDSIVKIVPALVEVQEELVAVKDSKNPHFKNGYASLDCILDSIKPSLRENGLTVLQTTSRGENGINCVTRVFHKSGEWIESECGVPVERNSPQGYGSSLTYARRYGLCTALGIGTMDDDDGTKAEEADQKKKAAAHFKRMKDKALTRFKELNIDAVVEAFSKSMIKLEEDDTFETDDEKIQFLMKHVKAEGDLTKIGKLAVELDAQEGAGGSQETEEKPEEKPAEKPEPAKKKTSKKKSSKKAPKKEEKPAEKPAEEKVEEPVEEEPEPVEEEPAEEQAEEQVEEPAAEETSEDEEYITPEGPNGKIKANKPTSDEPADDEIANEVYVKFIVDYFRKNVENTVTEEILAEYIEKDSTEWDYDARTGLIALLQKLMKAEMTLSEAFPHYYAK